MLVLDTIASRISMSFASRWNSNEPTFTEKVRASGPLKPRIENAQRKLEMQIRTLESILEKLKSKDKMIFSKIVDAIQKRDTQYSIILSNELAQIRKTMKMISRSKLALEQVKIRLNTISELGDVVVTLTPAMAVVKNVRNSLASMMPEVDNEMRELSDVLGGILMDAGQVGGFTINFDYANEEAAKIMEEAAAVAEANVENKLPDLPDILSKKGVESNYEQ